MAATAPAGWERAPWPCDRPKQGHGLAVVLCEERTVRELGGGQRAKLSHALGCPVVPVLFDVVRQPADFVVGLGGPPVIALDGPADGVTFLWTPIDPMAYAVDVARDKRAVFIGRTPTYAGRVELKSKLIDMGVTVLERSDKYRPYAEYAKTLCQYRAVVNLCRDRKTGRPHFKGRTVEALNAGAVLLEEANEVTASVLREGEEYLAWETPADLERLLRQIDRNPEWADEIARAGKRAAHERLSAALFWRRIEDIALQVREAA